MHRFTVVDVHRSTLQAVYSYPGHVAHARCIHVMLTHLMNIPLAISQDTLAQQDRCQSYTLQHELTNETKVMKLACCTKQSGV